MHAKAATAEIAAAQRIAVAETGAVLTPLSDAHASSFFTTGVLTLVRKK
jgi:hypothetical protein